MIGSMQAAESSGGSAPSAGTCPRRWRRVGILLAIGGLGLLALDQLNRSRTFQVLGDLVARVETQERVVAVTFDDGPTAAYTAPVLDILARHGVRATFFLTGSEVEREPAEVRRILDAGHEIGNHSYSHRRMIFVTPAFVRDELERTDRALRDAGCTGTLHFRPPYARKLFALPYELWRTGRKTIMWDVEPESKHEVEIDEDLIVDDVLAKTRPGSIILLHVMYRTREPTRRALPRILKGLSDRGYRFLTVSELLALRHGDS